MNPNDKQLVPVFMPKLEVLLICAENKKGEPLTETEVLRIRDAAPCIMMEIDDARQMAETRGQDIDPENCWHYWQLLRAELGRTPALPPGPRFAQTNKDDPEYQRTVQKARESLTEFRALIAKAQETGAMPMVKTELVEGKNRAFLWLCNARKHKRGFIAQVFEISSEFKRYQVGDEIEVPEAGVVDWMVNDSGVLHGGFSLRYQRSKLPEAERAAYDEYVGVTKYV